MSMVTIGEAARQSGVSAKMLRHYEQIGLIEPATRSDAGYRLYSGAAISTLAFIRHARDLGFSTAQIADLLDLRNDPQRASREVKTVAERHLQELHEQQQRLQQMIAMLQQMIQQCPGNSDPNCTILEKMDTKQTTFTDLEHQPDQSTPKGDNA